MAQKILFTFTAQDTGVERGLEDIRDRQKQVNDQIKEAKKLGNPYDQLLGESVKLRREQQALREEQRKLNNEFKATTVPKDSLAGLRLEYSRLTAELTKLSAAERNSKFGQSIIKNAADVKKQIDGIEQSIGRFTGNVGNYKSAALSFFDIFTGGIASGGVLAAISSISSIKDRAINVNAAISDSLADVAKAAELSGNAVESLRRKLEARETRTSITDQLGIAQIGGQLGVAEKDLFSFVDAVDVVNVALGDQFGGSVQTTTDTIGKLRNILGDIKSDNIGEDVLKIGNALNFLEAQGVAGAASIADFAGRIGGVGSALDISSGKIFGVSTTLAELGINAERGGSSFVRLLQTVAESPNDFAKAIDVPAADFKKLVNEDIFGAVELFLEKINSSNLSNTKLADVLKKLGLSGVGVAEVVSKLGGNLDLLRTRVSQSTKALTESSSVTQEFEKKNATLGASLDKLANAFNKLLSGANVQAVLQGVIDGFTELIETVNDLISTPLSQELRSQQVEFNALIGVLQDVTTTESERNGIINELKTNYPQYLKYVGDDAQGQIDLAKTIAFGNSLFEQRILLQSTEEQRIALTKEKIALETELTSALKEQQKVGGVARPGGVIRNEAADIQRNDNIAANAARRVSDLREKIAGISGELSDLVKSADETALRTTGKTLADIEKEINGIIDPQGSSGGDGGGDGKIKALAGSIGFLEAEVKKLEERVNKTPVDSGVLPTLIKQLDQAKEKLEKAKSDFLALTFFTRTGRQLTAPERPGGEAAPATIEFQPDLLGPEKVKSAKDQAEELRQEVEGSLSAIEFPIELKVDPEARRILDDFEKQKEQAARDEEDRKNKQAEQDAARQRSIREALTDAAVGSAQSVADSVFSIQKNNIDREQAARLDALNAQEEAAINAAGGNAQAEEQIRKEFEKKRQALEKEGARERKKIAIKEALINTALAITKALTGAPPPFNAILAAAAGIAGAAQVAAINSQEFWAGGKVKRVGPGIIRERQNAPRTAHGDTVLAYLKPGEMVLNERQQQAIGNMAGDDIFMRAGVPGVSRSFIPQFASGGVADFVPQGGFGSSAQSGIQINAQAGFSDDQVKQIGAIVGIAVAAAVGAEVQRGIGEGLNDANRRLEREQILETQRQG